MKEHCATKGGEKAMKNVFCDLRVCRYMYVFFLVFLIIWQQCLVSVSIAYAVEETVVNEDAKENVSDDEENDDEEILEDVAEEKDGEKEDENKDDEVVEDVDKVEDEEVKKIEEPHDNEVNDTNENIEQNNALVKNDVVGDETALVESGDEAGFVAEQMKKEIPFCFDENDNEIFLGDELFESVCEKDGNEENEGIHDEHEQGMMEQKSTDECGGTCEKIEIVNENDVDVSTQSYVTSDTGNNVVLGTNAEENTVISHEENDSTIEDDPGNVENYVTDSIENMQLLQPQDHESIIDTGDATSITEIFRDINTNIVGINWQRTVYDLRGVYDDDINLFEDFATLLARAENGHIGQVDIYNQNNANVSSDILVSAQTGNNMIDQANDAVIKTGDANAGANVINVVNQNIVGNNWLFALINVFGTWTGDLIVPGEGLLQNTVDTFAQRVDVTNINEADVRSEIDVVAHTGGNDIENSEQGEVETGDATAVAHITDVVNTNIINNNWFFLMINNVGSWTGNVLRWNEDFDGYQSVFRYVFDTDEKDDGELCDLCDTLRVHNDNRVVVDSNVVAHASSGNNSITGSSQGTITTGDAHAWTNIVNIINTNIVGNNWLFGIVNVMNEWTGDVVFAYPDLSVTISDTREQAFVGDTITYVVTYQNVGEAAAETARLSIMLPEQMSYSVHGDEKVLSSSANELVAHVAQIAPGESKSIVIEAMIEGSYDVQKNSSARAQASIETNTAEVNMDNNHASDNTTIAYARGDMSNEPLQDASAVEGESYFEINPKIVVHRASDITGAVQTGDVVTQRIAVENVGDSPVYDVVIMEHMRYVSGGELVTYEWQAGALAEGETAIIDYAIAINPNLMPNDYEFVASAEGRDLLDEEVRSNTESIHMAVAASIPIAYEQPPVLDDQSIDLVPQAQAYSGDKISTGYNEQSRWFWVFFTILLLFAMSINRLLIYRCRRS